MTKDFWKGFFAGLVIAIFTAYSFFRIYWIMEVSLKYFHWHAVLWLYLSGVVLFGAISYLLYKKGKLRSPQAQKKYLVASGLFIGIYAAEIMLRLLGWGATYTEKTQGVFVNPAELLQTGWYRIGHPNSNLEIVKREYTFHRDYNSQGLLGDNWVEEKDSGEVRIMTLGDSFTEGDGCTFDSCYPTVLEGLLRKEFPAQRINVLNAGICGSDPWFEYKKLHDLLLLYKPDIVVYTNGSNDLNNDHLIYGGMERFMADSTVKNKMPRHWWIGWYEVSYVFRSFVGFCGYDATMFSAKDRQRNGLTSIADSKQLSSLFSRLATENDFQCIQVLRPEKYEIENDYYDFDRQQLLAGLNTLPRYTTFDLLRFYKDSLHITKANVQDYYWQFDQHHNTKGYAAMATAVASSLRPVIIQKANAVK